jgi:hypothetical protein
MLASVSPPPARARLRHGGLGRSLPADAMVAAHQRRPIFFPPLQLPYLLPAGGLLGAAASAPTGLARAPLPPAGPTRGQFWQRAGRSGQRCTFCASPQLNRSRERESRELRRRSRFLGPFDRASPEVAREATATALPNTP